MSTEAFILHFKYRAGVIIEPTDNERINFIIYFVVAFLIVSDLITSLVLGLVRKGEAKSGLRYFLPLVLLSLALFFIVRIILRRLLLTARSWNY